MVQKISIDFYLSNRSSVGPHEICFSHEGMGYFPQLEVIYVAWIFRIVSSSYSRHDKLKSRQKCHILLFL